MIEQHPKTAPASLAVIIPLAESMLPDDWPGRLLADAIPDQVFVAASDRVPRDVLSKLERRGCAVLQSDAPRGQRLRDAAAASSATTLLFLHSDTRLPPGWKQLVTSALTERRCWGVFRLAFERRRLAWVAWGANTRSRLLGLPFGDQAPFVTRAGYERVGGHPAWPRLDDLELTLRLRRIARPVILRAAVETSARRYERLGALRTVLRNARILCGFALGRSPADLDRVYRGSDAVVTADEHELEQA